MAEPTLQQAAQALNAGDKESARRLVKSILKQSPSADAWYLAARAMDDDEQAVACLKKALTLDEWHTQANRLLHQLEDAPTLRADPVAPGTASPDAGHFKATTELPRKAREMGYQVRDRRRTRRRRFIGLMVFVLMLNLTLLTGGMIGLYPGAIGFFIELFGGPEAVTEVEGVPIEALEDAPLVVPVAQSKVAEDRDVDIIDHGYNHEYTFEATAGTTVLGYVQIMSPFARNVEDNVVILTPNDRVAPPSTCVFLGENGILGGRGNTSFECDINQTGTWKLRLLGIRGETTGAYFVGVETLGASGDF